MLLSESKINELIAQDLLYDLFIELGKFFKQGNDELNGLMTEYINPPANYNPVVFIKRLRLFIMRNYHYPVVDKRQTEIDDYTMLCELDFKLQTKHFKSLYRHKKIAAFLAHGENDEHGNDVKWLYNQLLHQEGLLRQKNIVIDFGTSSLGTFEEFLDELFLYFNIDTNSGSGVKHMIDLRSEWEELLKSENLVVIIKSPEYLLSDKNEVKKLFNEFFYFMDLHLRPRNENHSLIFLFLESKKIDYHLENETCFISFDIENPRKHANKAKSCADFKIIDLAPITRLEEEDIEDWIDWSLTKYEITSRIEQFRNQEKALLADGEYPFQVITKICSKLNIQIEKEWIQ
jgi:hypothetical protein